MDKTKMGASDKQSIKGQKALLDKKDIEKPQRNRKKEKLLTAEEFFKIKDSDKKFTGPKSTKGSLGEAINQFREMDDKIILMAKGGRVGLKSGSKGCKLAMKGKGRAYGKNS